MTGKVGFLALVLAAAAASNVQAAATIVIVNADPAGVGFNDATVVAPVGGNAGTTLGQQRLIAFQAAANKWGATLTSAVTIRVRATWVALSCNASSAVLGSAGATEVFRDFTGAPQVGAWFGKAEANKLFGAELDAAMADITASFNVNLGNAGCLTGIFFYLGLDNNHGANVDLVTVLEHEFGHGLGFQTYTNGSTGALLASFPSIWDFFLFDTTLGTTWNAMTQAQRAASSLNTGGLVWSGSNVNTTLPGVLQLGSPVLNVTQPAGVAGLYSVGQASFGLPVNAPGVTGEVMPVVDTAGNIGLACNPLSAANAAAVNGHIALLDRGTCTFPVKVKNAQNAGAIGAIIVDNVASGTPLAVGGSDPTITIPIVGITQANGNTLKTALATRSRTHSGMFANIGTTGTGYMGADASGRIRMFAPNPFQGGSSVSHFDTVAYPNQLMEPAINVDLTHEVTAPQDLTFALLKDIGWN